MKKYTGDDVAKLLGGSVPTIELKPISPIGGIAAEDSIASTPRPRKKYTGTEIGQMLTDFKPSMPKNDGTIDLPSVNPSRDDDGSVYRKVIGDYYVGYDDIYDGNGRDRMSAGAQTALTQYEGSQTMSNRQLLDIPEWNDGQSQTAYERVEQWLDNASAEQKSALRAVQRATRKGTEAALVNSGEYSQELLDEALEIMQLEQHPGYNATRWNNKVAGTAYSNLGKMVGGVGSTIASAANVLDDLLGTNAADPNASRYYGELLEAMQDVQADSSLGTVGNVVNSVVENVALGSSGNLLMGLGMQGMGDQALKNYEGGSSDFSNLASNLANLGYNYAINAKLNPIAAGTGSVVEGAGNNAVQAGVTYGFDWLNDYIMDTVNERDRDHQQADFSLQGLAENSMMGGLSGGILGGINSVAGSVAGRYIGGQTAGAPTSDSTTGNGSASEVERFLMDFAEAGGYTPMATDGLVGGFDGSMDAAEYASAFDAAYKAGMDNQPVQIADRIGSTLASNHVPEMRTAFFLGQNAAPDSAGRNTGVDSGDDVVHGNGDEYAYRTEEAFGPGTVGSAATNMEHIEPGRMVKSQTNSIRRQAMFDGLDADTVEELSNHEHEEISIARQDERAWAVIDAQGVDTTAEYLIEDNESGKTWNDEDVNTAYQVSAELNQRILDNTLTDDQRAAAVQNAKRMASASAAQHTIAGRSLGYLGNKVRQMNGTNMLREAQGAVDKIMDAMESGGGATGTAISNDKVAVTSAVDAAQADAEAEAAIEVINAATELWKQRADEAKQKLQEARRRANKAEREAAKAESAADKAEKAAADRVRKAGNRRADAKMQKGSAAERLAQKVTAQLKPKSPDTRTAVDRMVSELFRLAQESLPSKPDSPTSRPTAIDVLREVWFNDTAYEDTWQKAQDIVRESIDDPAMLDALEAYLAAEETAPGIVSEKTMKAAITKAVLEMDGSVAELTKQLAFNNYDDVVDRVTQYLGEQIGLYDDTDGSAHSEDLRLAKLDELQDAVADLLWTQAARPSKIRTEDGTTVRITGLEAYDANMQRARNTALQEQLKASGIDLRKIVKQSAGDRAAAQQSIVEAMVRTYGLEGADLSATADAVMRTYRHASDSAIRANMKQAFPELRDGYAGEKSRTMKSAFDRFMEVVNMGQYDNAAVKELVAARYGIPGLTSAQVVEITRIADSMAKMDPNSKAYSDAVGGLQDILAEAMGGGSWRDTMAGLPYVSMLSSILKTGTRNVVGNTSMGMLTRFNNAVTRPLLQNTLGRLLGTERTTASMLAVPGSKAAQDNQSRRQAAFQYYIDHGYGMARSAGKYDTNGAQLLDTWTGSTKDVVEGAKSQRQIYNKIPLAGRLIQNWANAENATYGAQDDVGAIGTLQVFSLLPEGSKLRTTMEDLMNRMATNNGQRGRVGFGGIQNQYVDAFARGMKAKGLTNYADLESHPDLAKQISIEAAQQAKEATFHDDNMVSEAVRDVTRRAGVVGRAIMPFAKTPANVAVRAAEYSPLGAVEAAYKGIKLHDTSGAVDALSKSLTGSALMALGFAAAKAGLIYLNVGYEREDQYARMATGAQNYALNVGELLRDIGFDTDENASLTLDSLSPAILPFFMGAGLADADGTLSDKIGAGLLSLWDPMANMTMLSGISDLISDIQSASDSNQGYAMVAQSVLTGIVSQYIPVVAKQVGRALEPNRQRYYSGLQDPVSRAVDYSVQSMTSWLPGSPTTNDYTDLWGRTEANEGGNLAGRLLYNLVSPAYYSEGNGSAVDEALYAVYNATGADAVFPKKAPVRATLDGESRRLTLDEYTAYSQAYGEQAFNLVNTVVTSSAYDLISDELKVEVLADMYQLANIISSVQTFGKSYKVPDTSAKFYMSYVDGGLQGAVNYSILRKSLETQKAADVLSTIANMDISDSERAYLYTIKSEKAAAVQTRYGDTMAIHYYRLCRDLYTMRDEPKKDDVLFILNSMNLSNGERSILFESYRPDWKNPYK